MGKVSDLTATTALAVADEIYAVNGGLSRKITAANLAFSLSRLAGQFNPRDDGAKIDGVTDDTASWNLTIAQILANGGGTLVIPHGISLVAGTLTTIANVPVRVVGEGINSSIIKLTKAGPSAHGLVISQTDFLDPTICEGFSLLTTQAEPGDGLQITYAGADATNNRNYKRCRTEHVEARGDDKSADGWLRGIVGIDIHNWDIRDCTALGRQNDAATGKAKFTPGMTDGIILIGSAGNPSNMSIFGCWVWNADNAFRASLDVEGMLLDNCGAVACDVGAKSDRTPVRPWTRLIGNHFNVFTAGADLSGSPQAICKGNLIYKFDQCEAADNTWAYLLDDCDLSKIEGDDWINLGTSVALNGNWNGAKITDSNDVKISDITHERPSTTISIEGTSIRCRTKDIDNPGTYTGAAKLKYQDIGSGQNSTRRDSPPEKLTSDNAGAVTVLNTATAVAVTASFDVEVNDIWEVIVQYRHEKGATAGDTSFTVAKSAGTSVINFMDGETAVRDRFHQLNTNPDIAERTMKGEFNVTTRGTLTLQLSGTSLGSNGTVPINKAQLVVRRVG